MVSEDEIARCRVELAAGREVVGTVVDTEERPVAGARVVLSPTLWRRTQGKKRVRLVLDDLADASFLVESRDIVTGAEGKFALSPLALTAYDLTVTGEGYSATRVFDVPDGEDVRVVLSRGRQVEVLVIAMNDRGISDAEVRVEAVPSAPPAPGLGPAPQPAAREFVDLQTPILYEGSTDRSGYVAFEALERGRYELTVAAEGYVAHTKTAARAIWDGRSWTSNPTDRNSPRSCATRRHTNHTTIIARSD